AAVDLFRLVAEEAADVVAPEGEAGEAQREAAAQRGREADVGLAGVAAPVDRVTLAARPRAARPDDAVARDLLREVRDHAVVAQRVQVVLVEARAARRVQAAQRRGLAEVDLDR